MHTQKIYRLSSLFVLILMVISTTKVANAANLPAPALATTQVTFTATADAYVTQSNPDTNYGTKTSLLIDSSPTTRSYLRFIVSGLNGSAIQSAKLRIYANSANSAGYSISAVSDNTWAETSITFNNSPPAGAALYSSMPCSKGAWADIDISSFVKAEGTYNLVITTTSSTNTNLASRESGANAPQLVVTTGSPTNFTPTIQKTATKTPTPAGAPVKSSTPTQVNTQTPTPVSTSSSSAIMHVFVVLMENHSYKEVWNTSSSPYITSLGNQYARATDYHAITHPSLPNYLDLYGGSNYTITTDCSPSTSCHINATNLADNLDAKGLTWKGYMESMPSACDLTTSGNYAPKHNPFVYFDDIRTNSARCTSHVVPYTALASDLASAAKTPNFAMITPNLCNDMHNCSVSTGDTWLKNNLPAILNSPACTVDKCLVALTWDEDDSSQSNQVLTIFAGSGARTGGATSAVSYTHFSLLRTVEYIFGLPTQTSKDAAASPMTDLLH